MSGVVSGEAVSPPLEAPFADYLRLLKPRVMSLAVFTAWAGMVAAPGTLHPAIALAVIICVAAGAGAAGALNMWWDADIDRTMARTAGRPVAAGRIAPATARDLGIGLGALACGLLALFANALAGALLALTIVHYAVVYTMLLKRRTVHSVTIGGLAGALPPVIGWAAATGTVGWEAVLMAAVILLWTPPHSWALTLLRTEEYRSAGVPALPVVVGAAGTCRQILLYTALMTPAGAALALTPPGGPLTLAVAALFGGGMLARAFALRRVPDSRRAAGRLFGASIAYLFALFLAVLADAVLTAAVAGYGLPGL